VSVRHIGSAPVEAPAGKNGDAPTARERRRLETRERLFEAAIGEFRVAGFAQAQIDRIAEKAGVSRGTFYFHFPTKEHVLLEMQRRGEAEIVQRLRSHGAPPESVREFLVRVYETIVESFDPDERVRRELLAMYVRQPVQLELVHEPLIVEVVDYFAEAAERGAVRDDIPPEQLALRFLSSLFSLMTVSAGDFTSESGREAFDVSIELFLHGAAR
jgi:AcrR family transcriptional regulator